MRLIFRLLSFIVSVLIIGLVALLVFLGLWDQKKEDLPVIAQEEGNINNSIEDELLFLLVGVDDTGEDSPKRTDTLMVFRVQFDKGRITALSIPRDTRCPVEGNYDKVNHAYAYGGIELTMQTLRDYLGLDLDYYMVVDYKTVTAMIDAGGGVDYAVPEDLVPLDWEVFRAGKQHMDGEKALSFLRHRNSYPEGDLGRVVAQQAFIKEAMGQIFALKNFYRYPFILYAFTENAKTNIKALPLISQILSISRFKFDEIGWNTLPGQGEYIDGISYYRPDEERLPIIMEELFSPYLLNRE